MGLRRDVRKWICVRWVGGKGIQWEGRAQISGMRKNSAEAGGTRERRGGDAVAVDGRLGERWAEGSGERGTGKKAWREGWRDATSLSSLAKKAALIDRGRCMAPV